MFSRTVAMVNQTALSLSETIDNISKVLFVFGYFDFWRHHGLCPEYCLL